MRSVAQVNLKHTRSRSSIRKRDVDTLLKTEQQIYIRHRRRRREREREREWERERGRERERKKEREREREREDLPAADGGIESPRHIGRCEDENTVHLIT